MEQSLSDHARAIRAEDHPLDDSVVASDDRLHAYRHLAVRVLARAVLDVMNPGGSATDRESARAFLAGSVMLRHWCELAAINPDRLSRSVDRLTAGFAIVPAISRGSRPFRESDVL